MKDIELLKQVLIRHEGKVNKVYLDTMQLKTAGIGHLLTGNDKNMAVGTFINDGQVDAWFEADIDIAIRLARSYVPKLDELDPVRQVVIVSLAFNLGNKLGQFVNTLRFINAQEWDKAASNLQQSLWFKQVRSRGPQLVDALRTGVIWWSA